MDQSHLVLGTLPTLRPPVIPPAIASSEGRTVENTSGVDEACKSEFGKGLINTQSDKDIEQSVTVDTHPV